MAPPNPSFQAAINSLPPPCRPGVCKFSFEKDGTVALLPEHQEQLRREVAAENLSKVRRRAFVSPRFLDTDEETRQFLKDIALVFSRERTGATHDDQSTSGNPEGPSYVAAAILSQRPSEGACGKHLFIIHVALNKYFGGEDTDFARVLVGILNEPSHHSEDGEEHDIQRLSKRVKDHCAGRVASYDGDVQHHSEACDHVRAKHQNKASKIPNACRRIVQFRNKRRKKVCKFTIEPAATKLTNAKENVHCEMKLVHESFCGKVGPEVFDYIGCSKLPCLCCWYIVNMGSLFVTDETHWTMYLWSYLKCSPNTKKCGELMRAVSRLDVFVATHRVDLGKVREYSQPQSPVEREGPSVINRDLTSSCVLRRS